MRCYLCQDIAVSRCYTCGQLICARHGSHHCTRCETSVTTRDYRSDRISATPLGKGGRTAWWRPQPAEEYHPPACYQCKSLARQVCRGCDNHFCREHAGSNGLCACCARSATFALWVLAALGVGVFTLLAFSRLTVLFD